MHFSTKTYGHDIGLSACFRQWRAASHCHLLHGYAMAVTLTFAALELDERNWVMDFGGLQRVKKMLTELFDHKLLIAADDPLSEHLLALADKGLAEVVVLPAVGCEAFAKHIHQEVSRWLVMEGHAPRVHLVSAEVREHGANSAIYAA